MNTYSVLYAEDVPHYGMLEIRAPSPAAVIEKARAQNLTTIAIDPDYDNSACKRIVHIEDEEGTLIAHDIPLDNCFLRYGGNTERRLCDQAPDLLATLRTIAAIPLYGEDLPAAMEEMKPELIDRHEYDLENKMYTPCVDTESSHLQHAVELARTAVAKLEGGVS